MHVMRSNAFILFCRLTWLFYRRIHTLDHKNQSCAVFRKLRSPEAELAEIIQLFEHLESDDRAERKTLR